MLVLITNICIAFTPGKIVTVYSQAGIVCIPYNKADMDELMTYLLSKDFSGVKESILADKICVIEKGTKVRIIDSTYTLFRI
jgi:hypothetical protein